MHRLALLVLLVASLAGCAESGGGDAGTPDGAPAAGGDMLSGWVLDPSVTPVVDAKLSIQSEGLEVATNSQGHYAFDTVPYDVPIVVVVQADGFQPESKSLTVLPGTVVVLNFTLERVPVQKPYHDELSFQGHLGCDTTLRYQDTVYRPSCSSTWPNHEDVWQFNVDPKLAGIVMSLVWDAGGNPAAEQMRLLVETVGYGDFDEVLVDQIGPSPLAGQVPQIQAQRFYAGQGGTVRVTVSSDIDVDANESGVGASAAVEQGFELFAFPFYIQPPPPGYTIPA